MSDQLLLTLLQHGGVLIVIMLMLRRMERKVARLTFLLEVDRRLKAVLDDIERQERENHTDL